MIEAVIFDMDGLLVDSEPMWFRARVDLLEPHGETWTESDQLAMAGVHTDVWVATLHDKLAAALSPEQVFDEIVARMAGYYENGEVPILAGAHEGIAACAGTHPVTPGQILPASEQLGDLLLELDRAAEALVAFEKALTAFPNRLNAHLGAAKAAARAGNKEVAREHYRQLLAMAGPGDGRREAVKQAKLFIDGE